MLINLLFMGTAFSQNTTLKLIESEINSGKNNDALKKLNTIKESSLQTSEKALYYYLLALCYNKQNNEVKAYDYFLISRKLYKNLDSIEKAADINLCIAHLIFSQDKNKNNHYRYANEYMAYALKNKDKEKIIKGYITYASFRIDETKCNDGRSYLKKAMALNDEVKDAGLESTINNNFAVLYNECLEKPDSALYYLKKDLEYLYKNNDIEGLYHNYTNQAASYYYLEDYNKSIMYLQLADKLPLTDFTNKSKLHIYKVLSINYEALGDYQNAYKYLTLNKILSDSINEIKQNIAINDIQTKYQTKERELENLRLKGFLYTFLGLLVISIIIGWLIIKNSRRKEKILKQEKLIEQQKLEKALKDYELSSIDIMLESQEKERQRIANDLHDNLGSMLATLKLNFENLKLRKNEVRDEENKLYERTDELIEEAYQKVRRIAHAKNAGVFANEGLIPALQKLAEKISIPGKLTIEIIPFGFNERIENTIEIAIFRMIQELATNIIKHSQATEATIHLTKHDDNINIIVEDNGIGIDSETMPKSDGMGITAIQKKCEQLGGTMTIDATPGKGTTIIIDIPV